MKKLLSIFIIFLSAFQLTAQNLPARPNPPKLVNDYAHVLSPEQLQILEQKLTALDDSTSNQIAIVLLKSLDGYPIEDYAVDLFRKWGIGNKKTNNGVLIIAAIDDRKIKIEIGYGLEGAIPDITTNSIIQNDIAPNFREGNYYHGLDVATDNISKAATGEYKVQRQKTASRGRSGSGLFGFIVVLIIFLVMSGRGRGGGGGRGGMFSRRGYGGGIIGPMILGSMLGGGRSGGGWGGGDSGGFGGGGFGGFGGGSSGGGGASGGW
ncbi:MAG: hypothetical protein JWN76_1874 [Chitinophagaceae bacterium]|nr:hypothetical protein [Chitinophagaceae bacterium]